MISATKGTSRRATRAATLGPVKPLDRFGWSHPREIDRELFEEMHETLGFIARREKVLFRGQAGADVTLEQRGHAHQRRRMRRFTCSRGPVHALQLLLERLIEQFVPVQPEKAE